MCKEWKMPFLAADLWDGGSRMVVRGFLTASSSGIYPPRLWCNGVEGGVSSSDEDRSVE